MAELIDKWQVVSKLISLENEYQFFKGSEYAWDAEKWYRRICDLEIEIGKTPGEELAWIPVTERLPEEDGSYLVRTAPGTVTTARFYAFKSFPATKYLPACHRNAAWQSNRNVTHWMPLPTPPKGE